MALRSAGKILNISKSANKNVYPLSKFGTTSVNNDIETHTGQKWESDDYRLVRFVDKKKLVNKSWAVKLVNEIPPTKTKDRVVWCDGGSGPTGHPRVYINVDKPGAHACTYCGLRFEKEDHHH